MKWTSWRKGDYGQRVVRARRGGEHLARRETDDGSKLPITQSRFRESAVERRARHHQGGVENVPAVEPAVAALPGEWVRLLALAAVRELAIEVAVTDAVRPGIVRKQREIAAEAVIDR